ncbi:MAG TPA: glycosyltransferase, partial [Planctomycetota bacterium]|nr:glycosyltransferase [Planctomycetota bacterium]
MRVLTRANLGGPTRQVAALWHAHAALGHPTLLVAGSVQPGETALTAEQLGVPRVLLADVLAGATAGGWLELPALGRAPLPWRDLAVARLLQRTMRAFNPDVVHTHTSKAGLLGRWAARRTGVPVIAHTFHGHVLRDYFGSVRSLLLRALERRLARHTDLLFAVSRSCADELAQLGIAAADRFVVVPPAVAVMAAASGARAAARRRLGVADDRWLVAGAGRLVPIKRFDLFLQVVAGDPALHGDLYGDGPLRAQLQRAAGARVIFRSADPALPDLLPAYDALLLPSRREGWPLVAIEAFAAGVPVVGFAVPGVA